MGLHITRVNPSHKLLAVTSILSHGVYRGESPGDGDEINDTFGGGGGGGGGGYIADGYYSDGRPDV